MKLFLTQKIHFWLIQASCPVLNLKWKSGYFVIQKHVLNDSLKNPFLHIFIYLVINILFQNSMGFKAYRQANTRSWKNAGWALQESVSRVARTSFIEMSKMAFFTSLSAFWRLSKGSGIKWISLNCSWRGCFCFQICYSRWLFCL